MTKIFSKQKKIILHLSKTSYLIQYSVNGRNLDGKSFHGMRVKSLWRCNKKVRVAMQRHLYFHLIITIAYSPFWQKFSFWALFHILIEKILFKCFVSYWPSILITTFYQFCREFMEWPQPQFESAMNIEIVVTASTVWYGILKLRKWVATIWPPPILEAGTSMFSTNIISIREYYRKEMVTPSTSNISLRYVFFFDSASNSLTKYYFQNLNSLYGDELENSPK